MVAGIDYCDGQEKQRRFELAKFYCEKGVRLAPQDWHSWVSLGTVNYVAQNFGDAVVYLENALRLQPNNLEVLTYLAQARLGVDGGEKTRLICEQLAQLLPSSRTLNVLASYYISVAPEGARALEVGIKAAEFTLREAEQRGSPQRTLRNGWPTTSESKLHIDPISFPEIIPGSSFGLPHPPGDARISLRFNEMTSVLVRLEDVFMEGIRGILYNDKHVFAGFSYPAFTVSKDYTGKTLPTHQVNQPVLNLIYTYPRNYYHWLIESLPRLSVARKLQKLPEDLKFLVQDSAHCPFVKQSLDLLKIDPGSVIEYSGETDKRYLFDQLYMIDFYPESSTEDEGHDLWQTTFPAQYSLKLCRDSLAPWLNRSKEDRIVYIARKGIRQVKGEQELIARLKQEFPKHELVIFDGSQTFLEQIELFSSARVVIGPHGAGLANILFCNQAATIVEFPLNPHCNRCFGYLATALDLDYRVVPELSAFYRGNYQLSPEGLAGVVRCLREVL